MARKKRSAEPMGVESLLRVFRKSRKPLGFGELLKLLGLPNRQRKELDEALDILVRDGRLIRMRDAYGLADNMQIITGELEVQRSGVGFVLPEDSRRKDVFVSSKDLGDARHGDKVAVALLPKRGGRNPEGRVVRVLERRTEIYAVRILDVRGKGYWLAQATDPKLGFHLLLTAEDVDIAPQKNDIVLARIGERLEEHLWAGTMVAMLGTETDLAVQEQLVKFNHHVPTVFPETVLEQAAALPERPAEEDFGGRRDLRDLPLVTIDGATAKDFDDAVCVRETSKGFTLWVAIADVAHYVPPFTPLDEEARERGNSYYFPKSVEPMFPERLSNGLCSLNPSEPRLAMAAEMEFSRDGKMTGASFHAIVMQSHARLTYEQVHQALEERNPQVLRDLEPLLPMLEQAESLARILKKRRHGRGSLDFDLPDPEILLDVRGEAVDIQSRTRHFSHQIIEEFMIAANEAVAEFLTKKDVPMLYRIHDTPDPEKLRGLFEVLGRTELAVRLPKKGEPAEPEMLQTLLAAARDTEMEFLVNRLLLRSQMQAKYSPDNIGHFGLASKCYAHFTSPIRRYADLELHRALKNALSGRGPKVSHKQLKTLGDALSIRERRAMAAEREILKRVTVMFLMDRVGEEFSGVVSSLTDFGFWVELADVMADGMVRLSSLSDDYYTFFPERHELIGRRTGRTFRLGQHVQVVLEEVSLSRLEITLVLAPEKEEEKKARKSRKGKKEKRD
ncbi:RNAse R [Desulfonatronum thiosulfatophilum]|uniref:Ribonuclease R n=1 Tax=Desulfonatronum thiosulfatophilum TaxID=617002 RepID=A0A1G6C1D0_9BACT|nr:ribonuclease R [Desulfonatronum thiosulfatophilum]SDB26628.1 RNAse R [Desulfonatronum thiosulfatophilum]